MASLRGADGKTASERQADGNAGRGMGVTTGKTMYGNTAYGPVGGFATGYATRSPISGNQFANNNPGSQAGYGAANAGGGFGQGVYSNFRTPSGASMFSGGPGASGGAGVYANGGFMAQQMAAAAQARMMQPRPAGYPGGQPGAVTQGPLAPPPTLPPVPVADYPVPGQMTPNWYNYLQAYKGPYGPEINSFQGNFKPGDFKQYQSDMQNWYKNYDPTYNPGYMGPGTGNTVQQQARGGTGFSGGGYSGGGGRGW